MGPNEPNVGDRRANSLQTVVSETELHLPDTLTVVPTDPRGSKVRNVCNQGSDWTLPLFETHMHGGGG